MADIQPGTSATIAADVVANGVVMFTAGEQVTIQQVAPNAQRPEYKYVVFSAKSGSWFTLRDADLVAAYAPPQVPPPVPVQPQYAPPQQPAFAAQGQQRYPAPPQPQPQKSNTALKGCLIAAGIVFLLGVILVVVLVTVVGVGVHHVVNQVEKATKNGITLPGGATLSTKVPSEAELGVPIYPGSKVSSSSLTLKDQTGSFSAVILYSTDSPSTVISWYEGKLAGKPGYSAASLSGQDAQITFQSDNGGFKQVIIGQDTSNNLTSISISSASSTSPPSTTPSSP